MKVTFSKNSWEDYLSWQKEDKKILRRINQLIKDIQRTPYEGIGNPEPLKYDLAGFWSRQIIYTSQQKQSKHYFFSMVCVIIVLRIISQAIVIEFQKFFFLAYGN
jgi:toxin YoeB